MLTSSGASEASIQTYRQGLQDFGYIDGQTMRLAERHSEGQQDRLPALAAELAALPVDVIVAVGTEAAQAAQQATSTLPVVFISSDPIGTGLVPSLAHPGGNLTGVSLFATPVAAKRLELLREVAPQITRAVVIWNPADPARVAEFAELQRAASVLAMELQSLEVRGPAPDISGAFTAVAQAAPDALLVLADPLLTPRRQEIVERAAATRLPAMYSSIEYVGGGGLMSYSVDPERRTAPHSLLRGSDRQGCQARRPPGRAAPRVRVCHQPEDRPDAGADHPRARAAPGYRGASVIIGRRQFVQGVGVAGIALLAGCNNLGSPPQQSPRLHRVGFISVASPSTGVAHLMDAFRQELGALGYAEGQHILIEERYAEGEEARLPGLIAELVQLPVDVLFAAGPLPPRIARDATSTIPIVLLYPGDPVADRLVASLARPGGNVTGLTTITSQLGVKRLELLKQTVPGMARVAVLDPPDLPGSLWARRELAAAAGSLGVQLQLLEIREAGDLDTAFEAAVRERADALMVNGGPINFIHRSRIIAFAAQYHLPATYWVTDVVYAGAFMSYGSNQPAQYRRAAYYVDRILKGTKPADLPVEQPREFDFVINLKTAQALGLTIPDHVLLQATEVIQ
jgi:putative ABC transport system substrate-binding protein